MTGSVSGGDGRTVTLRNGRAPTDRITATDPSARARRIENNAACLGGFDARVDAHVVSTKQAFARSWADPRVTLDDLFFVIRTTMPPNNTEALSQEERAAVFAHILACNLYPAGRVALTEDLPQLRKERLEVTVRHSPLTQIDAGNASRLVPVCMFQMGEFGNFQSGPIVQRGVMYVTAPTVTVATATS